MVVKCSLQLLTASGKVLKLSACIVVKLRTIGGGKVTEYRARLYYILALKHSYKLGHVTLKKSQSVHSGVKLYVHRIIGYAVTPSLTYYLVQNVK